MSAIAVTVTVPILAVAPSLGDAIGDLVVAILIAAGGALALTISILVAMRGGAGFVDLDREGRFPVAILALALAGAFSLVALGVVVGSLLFLVRA